MCEEDGDRGIDGRCSRSIWRRTKDGLHVAKVRHGMKRRERRTCVERRREDIVKGLGLGRHVENRVERRKRKFVRDVCAGDKRGDRKRCG